MNRLHHILVLVLLLTVPTFAEQRPNILLVMADDMGFSDLSF